MGRFSKTALFGLTSVMSLGVSTAAYAADSVEIQNFIGFVNWSNGSVSAQALENSKGLNIDGQDNLLIDGGFKKIKSSHCKSTYGRFNIDLFGRKKEGHFGGYENLDEYPLLNITLPADARLVVRNSILFTKGTPDIGQANLDLDYCGDVTLGNIEGQLILNNQGSADIEAKSIGSVTANLSGSGDFTADDTKVVVIKSNGSGDVELANATSLDISLHGSGEFEAGNIDGNVDLSSHGSGDLELNHIAGSLVYSGHGSGDLDVASVKGPYASLRAKGSGGVVRR